jgi:UDP:flavonoid glycosyltransferase YjiC (YdhE family)
VARILFAWEFGGDLGHARRLVPVARELRALGHEPCLAFRELSLLGPLARERFAWFAAPRLRPPAEINPAPLNASDILLNLGFADANGLTGALRAWLSFFALVKPALLVADYAPTALLAARIASLHRITLGTGFPVPARGDPLPALRAWHPVDRAVLERIDARLLESVRSPLDRLSRSAAAPRCAWDLFDAKAHLLGTFEELDPFGPRDGVEYLGAQGDARSGLEARWSGTSPRIFAYLKPRDPRFISIVEALRAMKASAIVAAPGIDPDASASMSGGSMRVFAGPVQLDPLLAEASLCVFHGGPGLAARALAAGVPMALLPMQLEQFLVGKRLVDLGVARMVAPEEALPDPAGWIAAIAANEALRAAARERARPHAGYAFDDAPRLTARRIAAEAEA